MDKSNIIKIYKAVNKIDCYQVYSMNKFFYNKIKVTVDQYTVRFCLAALNEKCHTPSVVNKKSRQFRFYSDYEIPIGDYEISEDSTEDELIIDWNN